MSDNRPSWDEYFMRITFEVAQRSTCNRAGCWAGQNPRRGAAYAVTGETWYSMRAGAVTRRDASRISIDTRLPPAS